MRRRLVAYALLLWYLPACTTWYVREGITLKDLIAIEHPNAVRLTRTNGSYVVVKQPRFVGSDSLAGIHNGVYSNVAAVDVTEVATQKVDESDTVMLVVGLSFAIGMLAYVTLPCDVWDNCGPDALSAHHIGGPN